MQEEVKTLRTQLKKGAAGDLTSAGDALFGSAKTVGGAKVLVGEVPPAGVEQIRTQLDRLRQKAGTSVVLVGWADEGKVGFMSSVTDDLTAKVQAGNLVGEVAKVCGGKGGGRPGALAQAGGGDLDETRRARHSARDEADRRATWRLTFVAFDLTAPVALGCGLGPDGAVILWC